MKESARITTKKDPEITTHSRSHSESPANRRKSSSTSVHRSPQKQAHAAGAENQNHHRRVVAIGTQKRGQKRRIHASGLENWVPQGPVHIGGVKNPAPEPQVHFAGVENRSAAAHLNDFRADPHPKPAANPLHSPFPGHRKQP